MAKQYDAIIIGTGQAGPSLAGRMTEEGWKVAIVEKDKFGGTCVNDGCIPTKTLVASARSAYMVRRAADYGVMIDGTVQVDMKKVKARKDEVSGKSNQGVTKWLESMENLTIYRGHARFESSRVVRVGDELLEADKVFINVGGRATIPSIHGLQDVDYFTNTEMMDIDFLPAHLIILGGSYIGLEFGQMYRRFGSEVTVVQRSSRILRREDDDVSAEIQRILEKEGIRICFNADVSSVRQQGDEVTVQLDEGRTIVGSHLLLAIGRNPNTDDLGLDKAGIETDARGFISVDDELKTNVSGIWAVGDCNGRGAFTHTSYNDHEIVVANLFDNDSRRVSDRHTCYGLFIDPPLGRVGMTEREARDSGRNVLIGKKPMKHVGRAKEKGETDGFMKVMVDADTKEILGACVLGIGGDEVIHCILDAMYAKAPYTVLQRAVHIHPTVAELIPTMLGELEPIAAYASSKA